MTQLQIEKIPEYMLIGLLITMLIFLPLGIVDANNQKEELSKMSCGELNEYLIDKALNFGGFPQIAEKLYKYKCEVPAK